MAGNSNSGRRPLSEEARRIRVIEKAWDIYEKYLDDPDISLREKGEFASKIVVRNIPQKVEGDIKVTEMPAIQKLSGEANQENRIAEFLIGSSNPPEDT